MADPLSLLLAREGSEETVEEYQSFMVAGRSRTAPKYRYQPVEGDIMTQNCTGSNDKNTNSLLQALAFLASPAELLDRETGAGWRIRATLVSSVVWSAYSLVKFPVHERTGTRYEQALRRFHSTMSIVAGAEADGFAIDLTADAVRKSLGLGQGRDLRLAAEEEARGKCLRTGSARKFTEFFNKALEALSEREREREGMIEEIVNLVEESRGNPDGIDGESIPRDLERLEETLCWATVRLFGAATEGLGKALSPRKVGALEATIVATRRVAEILGFDVEATASKLEGAIEAQRSALEARIGVLEAEIAAKAAEVRPQQLSPERQRRARRVMRATPEVV
jgi:hypothetical protein